MSYQEENTETFYYFSKEEEDIIEGFLTERGYGVHTNTVCGNCCGMFADYYYLGGIGGGWKSKKDCDDFKKLCEKNDISCSFSKFKKDGYNYTISADPYEYDINIK